MIIKVAALKKALGLKNALKLEKRSG